LFAAYSGNIKCLRIDTEQSQPLLNGTPNSISTTSESSPKYDVVRYGDTDKMVIAYINNAGAVNLAYVIASGTVGGPSDGVPAQLTNAFGTDMGAYIAKDFITLLAEYDSYIRVCFAGTSGSGSNDIWSAVINTSFAGPSAAADGTIVTDKTYANGTLVRTSSTTMRLFVEARATDKRRSFVYSWSCNDTTNALTGPTIIARSVGLASKAFLDSDDNIYFVAAFETILQPTYFVMKYESTATTAIVMNTISKQEAYGFTSVTGQLVDVVEVETDVRIWPSAHRYQIQITNASAQESVTTAVTGLQKNKIILANEQPIETEEIGNLLFIANGQVQVYDGNTPSEFGFHVYPEISNAGSGVTIYAFTTNSYSGTGTVTAGATYTNNGQTFTVLSDFQADFGEAIIFCSGTGAPSASGNLTKASGTGDTTIGFSSVTTTTGSITAGTRQYVAVYQWYDKAGQIHLSTTSVPVSVTLAGTGATYIKVPTLMLTEKNRSGTTPVTIGLYRTKNNETTFYALSSTTISAYNLETTNYLYILDQATDTAIASNPILYTTGGIVDNITPNPSNAISLFGNRLVFAKQNDKNLLEFSKEYQAGVPIEVGDGFQFRADQGMGGVEAIARMDEKLIIFKDSSMYVQVGQGPLVTGQQNDYVTPVLISSEVGCSEPQSIVLTKNGLMFKSKKGFYLLDRSLQTQYIGADVHRYNNLTVKGAVVIPDVDHVRFVHSDGLCLVYNYVYNEWYTYSNLEALACCIWQNKFVVLRSADVVWAENEGNLDAGSYIPMRLKTAWIQVGGHQGFQRIYAANVIGKYLSQHYIEVKMRYDFDDAVRETLQFDPQTALGTSYYGEGYYGEESFYGGADGVEQFRIRPAIQKCQSVQFELRDYDSDSTDGGNLELTGLTLQMGVKQGLFKLRDAKNAITS
jgi:hypothetical protein